jgi:tRNA dimethylallyltransferase
VKAVFLLGPTASGKSSLALALAERFPVEIVSVDSAQVFRGMDIGTAKPSAAERGRVPHHLIDIIEPTETYSAGRFRDDALRLAESIARRGRLPLLVGGTMLYFRSLTRGLADLPTASPPIRAEIEAEAAARGWPHLHGELARIDPLTAARLEPTDAQRIERALEVFRLTRRPLSSFHAETDAKRWPFETLQLSLEPSRRAVLHERIAGRFREMLAAGLVGEVETLRARHRLDASMPSMRAVGYRQVWETLEGNERAESLEARGIAATRQLAKRQLTWLRSMSSLERFDCLSGDLERSVRARLERFLAGPPA